MKEIQSIREKRENLVNKLETLQADKEKTSGSEREEEEEARNLLKNLLEEFGHFIPKKGESLKAETQRFCCEFRRLRGQSEEYLKYRTTVSKMKEVLGTETPIEDQLKELSLFKEEHTKIYVFLA